MTAQIKQEDIIAKYQDLPEDLQKALVSSSFSNAITKTGRKFELAIDKVGELADETGLVMLGITLPSEYVKNLVSRLSVSQEKAKAIAEEINQKIFQPVRESLKKIHGLPAGKAGIETPPPAQPLTSPPSLLRKEGTPITKSPPLQGGVGEVIPPIFVKKMPEPIISKPDIIPAPKEPLPQNSLAAKNALEKELSAPASTSGLGGPAPKQRPQYDKDPYREIIEP